MDINYNKSRNNSWDLDMTMDTPILHDQHPYNLDYLDFPLQTHQILSTQIPNLSPLTHREEVEEQEEQLGPIKEMMYKIAAMQPVDIDLATIRKPKRRNVRISDDPQSVAARHRRERISEKIRILQRLVPGGTKMDTATMLDEAICYVKFLKRQVHKLQSNQESPCIGLAVNSTAGDWAVLSNNALGSTSSSSIERSAGAGFTFGGSDIPCDGLYFTSEVISD